ncbi:MAG TPA: carbohydrate kinase, partial [Spirochaetaceae bacterium]|nr:carbohydrate kinase [Spirochaetaceae bacterium]
IDIGMTNKKVAVYDRKLRMLDSASRCFEPLIIDGLEAHDLEGMEEWFLDTLAAFGRRFAIGAIAVSSLGATQVCVGADGKPSAPCLYYTHEPGEAFQERFYALAGDPEKLQAVTGTPRLSALINPAKALLFMQERFPGALERTAQVLNFPQYWGYRLTGQYGVEGTYIANHSYLWDWQTEGYSSVAAALGVRDKMPSPLRKSWDVLGRLRPELAKRTGLSSEVIVTMGIHDSNASLLPHLAKRRGSDFVLNSTGTWCVIMHPQSRYGFEPGELGKVVFFNRSAYLEPVKTAIFLGGMEYERWSSLIGKITGAKPRDPGASAYPSLFRDQACFILPELVPGSGQFPGSKARAVEGGKSYLFEDIESGRAQPAFMQDPAKAMATLNASLAIQTLVALGRAGLKPGTELYTEGGFRNNRDYNGLLAAALPDNQVRLTDIAEATAMGAAMTAIAAMEGCAPDALSDRFEVSYIGVPPMADAEGFAAYGLAWHELIRSST